MKDLAIFLMEPTKLKHCLEETLFEKNEFNPTSLLNKFFISHGRSIVGHLRRAPSLFVNK